MSGEGLRCALWNGEAAPSTAAEARRVGPHETGRAVAHDLCRHIAAETPFDVGARYTRAACCAKLLACSGGSCGVCGVGCDAWRREATRVRLAATRRSHASTAVLAPTAAELNASMCAIGCASAVHRQRERRILEGAGLRYEAPSPQPPQPQRSSLACEDSALRAAWRPWTDFVSCEDEARASQAEPLAEAPCASKPWLRVNCRASCGLCALNLTDSLRQPSWSGLGKA